MPVRLILTLKQPTLGDFYKAYTWEDNLSLLLTILPTKESAFWSKLFQLGFE